LVISLIKTDAYEDDGSDTDNFMAFKGPSELGSFLFFNLEKSVSKSGIRLFS
jgi:hypothetical protein